MRNMIAAKITAMRMLLKYCVPIRHPLMTMMMPRIVWMIIYISKSLHKKVPKTPPNISYGYIIINKQNSIGQIGRASCRERV